jgi:hypothetical protein
LISKDEAADIINNVIQTIKNWRRIAIENQIPFNNLIKYSERWDVAK